MQDVEVGSLPVGTARREQAPGAVDLGESHELVGLAIAVGVAAADDASPTGLLVERAVFVDADVDGSLRIGGEADGVGDLRGGGEERDLEAGGGLDSLQQAGAPDGAWTVRIVGTHNAFFELGAMHFEFEEAAPASGSEPGDGDADVAGAGGLEGEGLRLIAKVGLGLIREKFPVLRIGRAFDPVAVVGFVHFPDDLAAGDWLRLAEVDGPGLAGAAIGRAPAGVGIAIDGVFGGVAILRGGGGRFLASGEVDRNLFLLGGGEGLVVGGGLFVGGPEDAPDDEVEIAGIADGLGVVAEGGAEDASLAEGVGPGDDEVIDLGPGVLPAAGEGDGGVEQPDVVVELFVDGGPVFEAAGDGVLAVDEGDVDRLLGAVAGGVDADELEPVIAAGAVAVHGAVQVDRGKAVAVRGENVLDVGDLGDVGRAFVVDDDVVPGGPVGGVVHFEAGFGAGVARVDLGDLHIRPRLDAPLEQVFLAGVVVAAAAGDEERLERPGGLLSESRRAAESPPRDHDQPQPTNTPRHDFTCEQRLSGMVSC